MKTPITRRTIFSAIASLITLAVFILLIAGSELMPLSNQKVKTELLPDGRITQTVSYQHFNGKVWVDKEVTGFIDNSRGWKGEVEEKNIDLSTGIGKVVTYEKGSYIDGKRNGKWTVRDSTSNITKTCLYDMGHIVEGGKSGLSTDSIPSTYDILLAKNPLFIDFLKLFKLEDDTLKIFTDTLDALLSKLDFDAAGFDTNYGNVHSNLTDNAVFDSISTIISDALVSDCLYRMKSSELRLAELDRNRREVEKTYDAITAKYPGYLASMNAAGATNEDFGRFCLKLDSIMDSHGTLNPADPLFIDSVDVRLSKALMEMATASAALVPLRARFEKVFPENRLEGSLYFSEGLKRLKASQQSGDKALTAVINSLLVLYSEADVVSQAVKESCFLKRKWVQLPVITTVYSDHNSTTSVTLRGNVIESAGAEVTSRGFVWATTYNPTLENNKVVSGSGKGIFLETIIGLVQGKAYFARSFATNSAGTAYGNIIEFTTERAASVEMKESGFTDFIVYPNPAHGAATLNCSVSSAGDYQLTVLDMNGRAVLSKKINFPGAGCYSEKLDLTTFAAGFYNCRISNGKSTSVCRLVVTK